MYRLLVLLVILNIAFCYHCRPGPGCPWMQRNHNHRHGFGRFRHHRQENQSQLEAFPLTTFEEIGRAVIKIYTAIKNLCDVNNNNRTSEKNENDYYILKYALPEFKEADIDVKTMGRVIYTTANRKDGDLKSFADIRILPTVLKVDDARWVVEHKTLKILIPYKMNWKNEGCDAVTDDSVKTVSKMVISPVEFMFLSLNETDFHLELNEVS